MLMWKYALRNLARSRARTALTTAAVVLAVSLVTLGTTLVDGIEEHIMTSFARNTGHMRLRHPQYAQESRFEPLGLTVKNWPALVNKLEKLEPVVVACPRIRFGGMLQFTDTSTIINDTNVEEDTLSDEQIFGRKVLEMTQIVGIDPQRERSINGLESQLVAGRYFSTKTPHDTQSPVLKANENSVAEIMIGQELARRLGVKPNDSLELVSFHLGLRDRALRVAGIFDSGNRLANRTAYISIEEAGDLLDLQNQATEILLFSSHLNRVSTLQKAVLNSGLTKGLAVERWDEIGLMRMLSTLFGVIFGGLLLAILLVAAAGLLNTMLMGVYERRREIGTLLALGMGRSTIIKSILLEALLFAVVGSVLGAVLGIAGSLYLVEVGIEVGEESARNLPMPMGETLYGYLSTTGVLRAICIGVLTALMGALWPAMKASRLNPIDALKRH